MCERAGMSSRRWSSRRCACDSHPSLQRGLCVRVCMHACVCVCVCQLAQRLLARAEGRRLRRTAGYLPRHLVIHLHPPAKSSVHPWPHMPMRVLQDKGCRSAGRCRSVWCRAPLSAWRGVKLRWPCWSSDLLVYRHPRVGIIIMQSILRTILLIITTPSPCNHHNRLIIHRGIVMINFVIIIIVIIGIG